jgi:GNAT superfamily N-acetyltransferase
MVGAVLWEEKGGGLYFGRLAVDPAARLRGVARILVAAVETEARRRGLDRAHASVRIVLADNRRMFARLGFTETVASAHPGYSQPTTIAIEKLLEP